MATTPTTTEPTTRAPLTPEEKALNLEIAKFKLEQEKFAFEKLKYEDLVLSKGHFPIFPADHPQNVMWAFAEGVLGAKYIAAEARDNVNSIFYLLNTAHDLEISWTFALRVIGMTPRGQVVIPGNLMLAILHKKKFKVRLLQTTETVAAYEIERPDGSMKWSCAITWEQAHKAGWPYGKDGMKEPWKDPANMLRWRSLAYTARVVAADALGGLVYIAEEMDDAGGQVIDLKAEREADAKAEADPKLELKKIDSVPTEQVIDIPLKTTKPEPVASLSPQELRNEAFLKEQAAKTADVPKRSRKPAAAPEPPPPSKPSMTPEQLKAQADANAAEHGITDDDLPAVNADEPPPAPTAAPVVEIPPTPSVIDEKAALVARYDAIVKTYGGTRANVNRFAITWLGDSNLLSDITQVRLVLDVLENALFDAPPAAVKIYVSDPEQFAKNVKVNQNPSVPVVATDNPLNDSLPDAWNEETVTAAWHAMKARGLTVDKFNGVLKNFGINLMPASEAYCFFRLYFHHPDTTLLVKRCAERSYSLCACVAFVEDQLGAPLTEKTASDAATRAITNCLSEVISMEVVK